MAHNTKAGKYATMGTVSKRLGMCSLCCWVGNRVFPRSHSWHNSMLTCSQLLVLSKSMPAYKGKKITGEKEVGSWKESKFWTSWSLISTYLFKAVTCPMSVIPNSVLDPKKDRYILKDIVKVTCAEGYEIVRVSEIKMHMSPLACSATSWGHSLQVSWVLLGAQSFQHSRSKRKPLPATAVFWGPSTGAPVSDVFLVQRLRWIMCSFS